MVYKFTVDNRPFDVRVLEIKRKSNALDREDSGRSPASGTMNRNIVGQFISYDVIVDTKGLSLTEYDRLYELLTDNSAFHIFKLPYGQEIREYVAYVSTTTDTLKKITNTANYWGELSFSIVPKQKKV